MIGTLPRRERVGTASARFSTAVHVACLVLGVASLVGSLLVAFSPRGILPENGVLSLYSSRVGESWGASIAGARGSASVHPGGVLEQLAVRSSRSPTSVRSGRDDIDFDRHLTISDGKAQFLQKGSRDAALTVSSAELLTTSVSRPIRPGDLVNFDHGTIDEVDGLSKVVRDTSLGVNLPTEPSWESVVLESLYNTTQRSDPGAMSTRTSQVKFRGGEEAGAGAAPSMSMRREDTRSFPSERTSWESEIVLHTQGFSVELHSGDTWGDSEHSFVQNRARLWFWEADASHFNLIIGGKDGRVGCFRPEKGEAVYPVRCYSL